MHMYNYVHIRRCRCLHVDVHVDAITGYRGFPYLFLFVEAIHTLGVSLSCHYLQDACGRLVVLVFDVTRRQQQTGGVTVGVLAL